MSDRQLPRVANRYLAQSNPVGLTKKYSSFLALTVSTGLLFISACTSDKANSPIADEPAVVREQVQSDIEDKIVNSYARVAAKKPDLCPKLVQKEVDNTVIERQAEVMVNNSCDYFLYPKVGEHIAVSLNNDQIEALLVTPKIYNFANGDYEVLSYDKHVIRLSYDGAGYKPEQFSYDVTIAITE